MTHNDQFTSFRHRQMTHCVMGGLVEWLWVGIAPTGKRRLVTARIQSSEPTSLAGRLEADMLWIIFVGFVAGIIAHLLSPSPNNPSGFILTIVLGIAGAFLATFIGQTVGWYSHDQGAGFIGATVGALVVLFIWNRLVAARVIGDPGAEPRA